MLNVLTSPKRYFYSLIMILTLTVLSACTTTPTAPEDIPPMLFSDLQNNSTYLLKKDEQLGSEKNSAWQFVALQALITENKFTLADSIIDYLQNKPLTEQEQADLTLLIASKEFQKSKTAEAQTILSSLDYQNYSSLGSIYFLKLQTSIYIENNDHLAASDTLLILVPLLTTDTEKQTYHDLLFSQLILLPEGVLNHDENSEIATLDTPLSSEQIKQAWYELASEYQNYQSRANQLLHAIDNWKSRYSTHPALALMPTQLSNISEANPYQPENIAVLIPLSGRFERQGHAIQYGLLHAFYKQQNVEQNNTLITPMRKLHFFDTNSQSLQEISAEFKEKNIDFVIGPLLKKNAENLLPLIEDLPVLAFNSANKEVTETPTAVIPWHYAFPLSPEGEAKQAAELIANQTHKSPMLLAPNSIFGKRIAKAFNVHWTELAQDNKDLAPQAEVHLFNDKAQLNEFMKSALQTDVSERRISQMKSLTNLSLQTEVRSRRDIDAIYIISKRDELNLIKPYIDVSISPFAPSIPLYASSRSHLIDHDGKQNKELDKLIFSDSAYLLDANSVEFSEVQQVWPKQSYSTLRLFALGFDSYQLIEQLIPLQNITDYSYQGLVGELSLDIKNVVQAKLSWAQYQQGNRVEIKTAVSAE